MTASSLAQVLGERVVIRDGGLATELEARGHDLTGELWSAQVLVDDPDAIREVHAAYYAAGAEVATSASYQASIDGFIAHGLDAAELLRRSVALATEARDEHGTGWVAASVGPYGAALADGSEYRGDYGLTVAELRRWHRPRLDILAAAGPDVLAVETIPCLAEVAAIVAEIDALAFPAWLSVTGAGDRTRAGEPLTEAFDLAADCAHVIAVGVNCIDPHDVPTAVRLARQHTGKPAVAYPNRGEGWDAASRSWTGPADFDPDDAAEWVAAGARLVGGCCRVGPTDIAALAAALTPRSRSRRQEER